MTDTTPPRPALYAALALASADCNNPRKNATNPHLKNKFADLKEVLATVKPVLHKHGLGITQLVSGTAGAMTETKVVAGGPPPSVTTTTESVAGTTELRTIIYHAASGESLETTHSLRNYQPGTNDAQSAGIAITYMRRYAILSMLAIVGDEDGDGSEYDWNAPKASSALITAAEEAAKSGEFAPFWKGITPAERDLLKPEIDRLKKLAEAAKGEAK